MLFLCYPSRGVDGLATYLLACHILVPVECAAVVALRDAGWY